ncbi:GPI mannosyltransferase 4-like isoform X2 [Anoplophora glabripennis]|uniref:GPI mannosyltransferase 4-like isoform X2 n=1 Tax=Anoplophora glabripennis TaxID=217634 RepID=UPI000C75C027|nr:GPI mannosyltransferase 4-like isoform X2 [Anoplophora glabripennis]
MRANKFDLYLKVYWFLVLLRIILVFIPQTGFIHPDEFFQSVEVLADGVSFYELVCVPRNSNLSQEACSE